MAAGYVGLRFNPAGPCGEAFRVPVDGELVCTHGPDPYPPRGAAASAPSTAAQATPVPCIGDGTSGNRVQAVYAVASDQRDRYASVLPSIIRWAGDVEAVFEQSAAETGGMRRVRFVTDADCGLDVAHVVLSPTGDDSFPNTTGELRGLGLARPDRKYLVWMDASLLCGMATQDPDDRPGPRNASNGGQAQYARIDSGCWGYLERYPASYPLEAHELMHTLGAVHLSAPHATGAGHCWDGADVMCYDDLSGYPYQQVCPPSHQALFDCNHDDYFNTDPQPGNYLYTHWNAANSSFLEGGGRAPPKLALGKTGTGTGTVTSDVGGVDCGDVCWIDDISDGSTVVLTASPSDGSTFGGWSGDCYGKDACRIVVDGPMYVVASFDQIGGPYRPDALIGRHITGLIGDGVYNRTGAHQTRSIRLHRRHGAWFPVLIQNDARVGDSIHVWGTVGSDAVQLQYLLQTPSGAMSDVTPDALNGAVFFNMGPSGEARMAIRVRAYRWARRGTTTPIRLLVWSGSNESRIDVVRVIVKVAR